MTLQTISHARLAAILDRAHRDFQTAFHRDRDPILWPHRFQTREDQEVSAFLAAILAYGNVTSILASLSNVFNALGNSPARGIRNASLAESLKPFCHRFTKGIDIEIVCSWLAEILDRHGSIERFFLSHQANSTRETLAGFVRAMHSLPLDKRLKSFYTRRERSMHYLVSDPDRGSSCKRLNLFLRWVARPKDGIDLGLWKSWDPARLMLPIDTHVLKVIRELGWSHSRAATWSACEAATSRLRTFRPDDPIRYDFALCHLSMSGLTVAEYHAKLE